MKFKKWLFHKITLQKRNSIGKILDLVSRSLRNALENKINDNELSGEYRVLRKLADSKPAIVFDVGANVGIWTQELKKYSADSRVYLFEPIPNTFRKLQENIAQLKEVHPNQIALSDQFEVLNFNYYPSTSYFSSIYSTDLGKDGVKIEVESMTGDDFCDQNSIDQIDLLKIDVEGAENKVLKGFAKRLRDQKIGLVQFEYGPMNLNSKFLLKDFYELFEKHGYRVGKIYPSWVDWSGYSIEKENFILSNFVAVSKKAMDYVH